MNTREDWCQGIVEQLAASDVVLDYGEVGRKDQPDNPYFISVKMVEGTDSEDLVTLLGHEHFLILGAYVSDCGELIVDITDPSSFDLFYPDAMV